MSVTATKSTGSLSVSWSSIGYGIQSRDVIIIIRDVTSQLEWIVTPTSHTVTCLTVNIPEPQCEEHTFKVQVFYCDQIPNSNGLKVVRTATTTATADVPEISELDVLLGLHEMALSDRENAPEVKLNGWPTLKLSEPLGVRVNANEMLVVIAEGASLPTSAACYVTTSRDDQKIAGVKVYSGRNGRTDLNRLVGQRCLSIPENMQNIEGKVNFKLTLKVDSNGQVTVGAAAWKSTSPRISKWNDRVLSGNALRTSSTQFVHKPVLSIERSTYSQASLSWSRCLPQPDSWLVTVTRLDFPPSSSCYFLIDGCSTSLDLPLSFSAGKRYEVTLTHLGLSGLPVVRTSASISATCYRMTVVSSLEFTAELTVADIRQLYDKAIKYCSRYDVTPCNWLYRNRWPAYFDEIFNEHGGVMEAYDKDNSGDQASPINGQIKGLFFMAKNENGQPPPDSPFGSDRIQVPPGVLLDITPNAYFVDFYCMHGKIHYVTMVMTRTGSEADVFCRGRLLPLDLYDRSENPFLFWEKRQLWVNNTYYLLVELFYTEDIDIVDLANNRGAKFIRNIQTIGRGRSTPGGIPKNPACSVCNLNKAHLRGLTQA